MLDSSTQTDEERHYAVPKKKFQQLNASESSVYRNIMAERAQLETLRARLENEMLKEDFLCSERETSAIVQTNLEGEELHQECLKREATLKEQLRQAAEDAHREVQLARLHQVQAKDYVDGLSTRYLRRMKELQTVAKQLGAHHTFVVEEKRKIARQRLNLDLALQQLSHCTVFAAGGWGSPHLVTSPS